jgi:ribosomal protein S12 methylthiotransferase
MDRFVGRRMEVLVEESLDASGDDADAATDVLGLYLGRLFCHAPEVDGAAVIRASAPGGEARGVSGQTAAVLKAGDLAPCRVLRRAGFDLEVEVDGLP